MGCWLKAAEVAGARSRRKSGQLCANAVSPGVRYRDHTLFPVSQIEAHERATRIVARSATLRGSLARENQQTVVCSTFQPDVRISDSRQQTTSRWLARANGRLAVAGSILLRDPE